MATNISPIAMSPELANLVSKDFSSILKTDPSVAPFMSWLMQGGNMDQLAGTAEGAALGALVKDPATAQALNLGVQAMNGVDVTKGLQSAAAKAVMGSLNLNQDQTNIANIGLMAAMGATPLGVGSEIISLGQQYLPELFGTVGGGQPLINAERNKPHIWTLPGGKSVTTYAQPNNFANGQFTQVAPIVKDNATGKVYKNMAAYDYSTAVDSADPSVPPIVAQLQALKKATGEGKDPSYYGSLLSPADYQKQIESITAKVNDQITKMGNPGFLKGSDLPSQIEAIYALSDPTKYKSGLVDAASAGVERMIGNTNLTNTKDREALINQIKTNFGGSLPASLTDSLRAKYTADTKAYQDKLSATSPDVKNIIDKYTAPGAKPPALGSPDAVIMAKYFNAPASVIKDLVSALPKSDYPPPVLVALGDPSIVPLILAPQAPAPDPSMQSTMTPEQIKVQTDIADKAAADQQTKFLADYAAAHPEEAAAKTAYDAQQAAMNAPKVETQQEKDAITASATGKTAGQVAEFRAAQEAEAKMFADQEAARIAAYAASPQGIADAKARAAYDAQQAAMGKPPEAPAPPQLPMSVATQPPVDPRVAAETAANIAANDERITGVRAASKAFADQRTQQLQDQITAQQQAFTTAQSKAPTGAFGDMTYTQWNQIAPDAQTQFLATAQNFPQQQAADAKQKAANAALDIAPTATDPYGSNYSMAYADAMAGKIPMAQAEAIRTKNMQNYYASVAAPTPLPMAQSTVQLGAALPMATNPKPPA